MDKKIDIDLVMKDNPLDPVFDIVNRISTKVTETNDEFIFTTISDWWFSQTQRIISKQQLIDALTKQKSVKPLWPEEVAFCGACEKGIVGWDDTIDGEIRHNYCHICGQKVDWDDERT